MNETNDDLDGFCDDIQTLITGRLSRLVADLSTTPATRERRDIFQCLTRDLHLLRNDLLRLLQEGRVQ